MIGWMVLIYLMLGITLTVVCELMGIFDGIFEDYRVMYGMEFSDIAEMFIKGLCQFVYVVLWWVVVLITIITVIDEHIKLRRKWSSFNE